MSEHSDPRQGQEPGKSSATPPESAPPDAQDDAQDGFAARYAASSGVRRNEQGQIDVLSSVGGIQGLAESILPGLLFTVLFTILRELAIPLTVALVVATSFAVVRLVSRTPLVQALTGLVGVGICALVALRTGNAEDFFLPGFYTNAANIVAMSISVAVRWPLAGLLFGFIRGEGVGWRDSPARVKAYSLATWIIVSVLALRLAVQLPLYLAGNVAALGATRVAMGLPLYALGLWIAWLVSRPAPAAATSGSAGELGSGG